MVGMLGVANREGGYSHEQQEDLETIAPAVVQVLQRKKSELEREQAEKTLMESEQRLQAIIDGSDNAFYVKDLDGHFILINKHLEKLLGINRDEVIGKTDYDLFTPELADYYKIHDSKIIETGVSEQLEEVSDLVDGWHTFLSNKFPLYDPNDKLYAICGISTDITDLKRAEQECKTTIEFLGLMNKSKGTVDLVHSAINFFQEFSGFEAVCIRLKDGDDYPYFETSGFPAKFVKLENSLCVKNALGEIICDSDGYPIGISMNLKAGMFISADNGANFNVTLTWKN